MTKPWNEGDPVDYIAAAVRRLAPLGVKRLRLIDSGFEVEFFSHAPALLEPAPPSGRGEDFEDDGEREAESDEEQMERPPSADPFKDPVLWGGRRRPGYTRRPQGAPDDEG